MTAKNPPLKKVKYLRSYNIEKEHSIVLGGDSRWLSDIELLMEDAWVNLFCPADIISFAKIVVEHAPKIIVAELGAYNGSELKIFDAHALKGVEKILVSHSVTDLLSWRRTQLSLASRGVKCLELSSNPKIAAEELGGVFSGICSSGFSLSEDLQLIQNANEGYTADTKLRIETNVSKLFKILSSKFILDPSDMVSISLLIEAYELWKKPKDVSSSLHFAFYNVEHSIKDDKILKILSLSLKCSDTFFASGDLSELLFIQYVDEISFGRLSSRVMKTCFGEVKGGLAVESLGLRILRVA